MQDNLLNNGHSIYRAEPHLMLQVQTDSAGFCPLSIIATYKNSNPCYWKSYTQERESEVVTQSVTPRWLNLAALVCFCLKHPRVSWFSIMTFYMNKWIAWQKKSWAMLHQDHLTSSQPEGPLLWDGHAYAHWRCPYPPLPPPCFSTHRAPMDMAHH